MTTSTRRQTCGTLHTELTEMMNAFAAKHGLVVSGPIKGGYATNGPVGFNFRIALGEAAGESSAVSAAMVNHLVRGLSHQYDKDLLTEAFSANELYLMSQNHFGKVTGWNVKGRTSPLQYQLISLNGDPCQPKNYKTRNMTGLACRANLSSAIDLQVGDSCFVDYTSENPDDADDQSGFYAATVVSLGKKGATITYQNVPEAGQHVVPYAELIVKMRSI